MKAQKADILGVPVPNWVAPLSPDKMRWGDEMQGRYVRLEPLEVTRHCDDLFSAFAADIKNQIWFISVNAINKLIWRDTK